MSGIPGCGKTVLCSSIIEDLADLCRPDDDSLLVYFFFDFAARDKRIVSIFLRSLLSQILVQKRDILEPIHSLYVQHHGGFQQPSNRSLLSTLHLVLRDTERTYFVIDGIDECGERADLIETIEEIVDWGLASVHILAASRGEKDIEESFARMGSERLRLEGKEINEDIRQYVHRRMLKERWLKKWPVEIQTEITSAITEKAGERFRLATFPT